MSNPAVITLASMSEIKTFPYRFEVEDNIGEAIHIHYKDIRLDLTVGELLELARSLEEIIDDLVETEEFRCSDFDPVNLVGLAPLLPDLTDIVYDEVLLEDLLVDTYDEQGNSVLQSLKYSRVVKALNGKCEENDARNQVNYFRLQGGIKQENSERLLYNLMQIEKHGYPINNELIVLFNNDNIIYDGQHRAACLYYLYGNITVPARRLLFKGSKYSIAEGDDVYSDKVEVLCQDGTICYGKCRGDVGAYEILAESESIIIHNLPLSEEIFIDVSKLMGKKDNNKIMIEIKE